QMGVDRGITSLEPLDLPREKLERPAFAFGVRELVDIGEVAGARDGQAHGVDDGLALFQVRVAKAGAGILNRFVVILGKRPTQGRPSAAGNSTASKVTSSARRSFSFQSASTWAANAGSASGRSSSASSSLHGGRFDS